MADILQDIRYGLRALAKQPGFAAVALLSLALGIGLNATIFTVLDTLLLRPPAVRDPQSLVSLFTSTEDRQQYGTTSYPDLVDLAAANSVFTDVVGHSTMFVAVNLVGENRLALGEVVTANYFSALGIAPAIGRGFSADESTGEGAHPVVVISHALWRQRFGGSPEVLRSTITIKGRTYSIVGVAPASFTGLMPGVASELWVPVTMVADVEPAGMNDVVPSATGKTRLELRGTRWLFVKARLRDGVTAAVAGANVRALMARIEETYPMSNRGRVPIVMPMSSVRFHPMVDEALKPAGAIVMAAVGLVLLIACANLASMLLARGRLVRQFVVENMLLAIGGGALGLLVARWTAGFLMRARLPIEIPISFTLAQDERVFVFTVAVSLVTGLAFGLMPALRASRPALVRGLRDDGSLSSAGRRFSLRHWLVAGQVAVSVLLLIGGMLLGRSLLAARRIDPGFNARNVIVATLSLDMLGYEDDRSRLFFDTAVERLRALPGVTHVAMTERVPFSPNIQYSQVVVDGRPQATPPSGVSLDVARVSDDYFSALDIPIVQGRTFDRRDTPESPRVIVVSEALARRYFPGESAIGQRLRLRDQSGPALEIVGVARDYNQHALGERPRAVIHLARSQRFSPSASFLVRVNENAAARTRDVEAILRALEPNLVLLEMGPIDHLMATSLLPVSLGSALLAGLAALALLLSGLGLYGVIAYSVVRRTREIGIRMALGASRERVVRRVIAEALAMVGAGSVVGIALGLLAAQVLTSVLYGISPFDPFSYAIALTIVLGAALLAAVLPARRAAAVDPIQALKTQ
jgi:macrolide transport system ATP-binding/permease protein